MDHCFALSPTLREDGVAVPSMLGRCVLDFLRVRNRLVADLPFPDRLEWIVTKPLPPRPLFRGSTDFLLKFPRSDEGGGSNLARFPRRRAIPCKTQQIP